jgi:hypothetical protein
MKTGTYGRPGSSHLFGGGGGGGLLDHAAQLVPEPVHLLQVLRRRTGLLHARCVCVCVCARVYVSLRARA